jgi:hypothetical protein
MLSQKIRLADIVKDLGAYCGSLVLVRSHGMSLCSRECQLVELPVKGILVLGGAPLQFKGFT